jgi:hypothetical protein
MCSRPRGTPHRSARRRGLSAVEAVNCPPPGPVSRARQLPATAQLAGPARRHRGRRSRFSPHGITRAVVILHGCLSHVARRAVAESTNRLTCRDFGLASLRRRCIESLLPAETSRVRGHAGVTSRDMRRSGNSATARPATWLGQPCRLRLRVRPPGGISGVTEARQQRRGTRSKATACATAPPMTIAYSRNAASMPYKAARPSGVLSLSTERASN